MNTHIAISKVCKAMREYQKVNNIKEQCMTNTQFLYDTIKSSFPNVDVKAKAVICCNIHDHITIKHTIHLMIIADGKYYEPSYELYALKPRYFTSIKSLLENFKPNDLIKDNLKEILPPFMRFIELEKKINDGGLLICDSDFYHKQANYIQELFSN